MDMNPNLGPQWDKTTRPFKISHDGVGYSSYSGGSFMDSDITDVNEDTAQISAVPNKERALRRLSGMIHGSTGRKLDAEDILWDQKIAKRRYRYVDRKPEQN